MFEWYKDNVKKAFHRMPKMTVVSVISDCGVVGSVLTSILRKEFNLLEASCLGISFVGVFLTRDYLYKLNRFDEHMKKYVSKNDIDKDFTGDEKFMQEAKEYSEEHQIQKFEKYLERNFRR
ncbi:MAG: hypothetical protein WC584_05465 [Candidatus Pacearchaeota archaeon]